MQEPKRAAWSLEPPLSWQKGIYVNVTAIWKFHDGLVVDQIPGLCGWAKAPHVVSMHLTRVSEPECLNFYGPQASISRTRFLVGKSISLWNGFLETSISCEEIEDLRIFVVICCVWRKNIAFGQHISNNTWSLLNSRIRFPPPITSPKIRASKFVWSKLCMSVTLLALRLLSTTAHESKKRQGYCIKQSNLGKFEAIHCYYLQTEVITHPIIRKGSKRNVSPKPHACNLSPRHDYVPRLTHRYRNS